MFGPCAVMRCLIGVLSSFAIISLRWRELVVLLCVLVVAQLLVLCVSYSQCCPLGSACGISSSYSLVFVVAPIVCVVLVLSPFSLLWFLVKFLVL